MNLNECSLTFRCGTGNLSSQHTLNVMHQRGRSKLFRQKTMGIFADLSQLESASLIKFAGFGVAIHHFECDLAAAGSPGCLGDAFEEASADAAALMGFADIDIVDIQERFTCEGGEAHEADGDTYIVCAVLSEVDSRGGVGFEFFNQIGPHRLIERSALPKGCAGIAIEQVQNSLTLRVLVELRFNDLNIVHGPRISKSGLQRDNSYAGSLDSFHTANVNFPFCHELLPRKVIA